MPTQGKEQWVCLGRRLTQDGKVAYVWREHKKEGARDFLFGKKMRAGAGQLYEVNVTRADDGSVRASLGDYVGLMDDVALRTQWQSEDKTAQAAHDLASRAYKEKQLDYSAVLDPIITAYRKSDPRSRRLILIEVLNAIQKY